MFGSALILAPCLWLTVGSSTASAVVPHSQLVPVDAISTLFATDDLQPDGTLVTQLWADVPVPPSVQNEVRMDGPYWSWTYSVAQGDGTTAADATAYGCSIYQAEPSDPSASLVVTFYEPGTYQVSADCTVTYHVTLDDGTSYDITGDSGPRVVDAVDTAGGG
jgi:hypothetical protein